MVERSLVTVDGSLDQSLMADPLNYFSFQPMLHICMCYPDCEMVHIENHLLLLADSSQCMILYHIIVNKMY